MSSSASGMKAAKLLAKAAKLGGKAAFKKAAAGGSSQGGGGVSVSTVASTPGPVMHCLRDLNLCKTNQVAWQPQLGPHLPPLAAARLLEVSQTRVPISPSGQLRVPAQQHIPGFCHLLDSYSSRNSTL